MNSKCRAKDLCTVESPRLTSDFIRSMEIAA